MIYSLSMENVGPAPRMELEFGTRLNLITGDNGLGKSFLLDTIWWALTRKWPQELNSNLTNGLVARPSDPGRVAGIDFELESKSKRVRYRSEYSRKDQAWTGKQGRPWNPGLVIYAQADGGFSVWDPARNYWKTRGLVDVQDRPAAFVFSPKEVWDGLDIPYDGRPTRVCNGLVQEWCNWIREGGRKLSNMTSVLADLSPSNDVSDRIVPKGIVRLSAFDSRDVPSIQIGNSGEIPILHASAGIRRVSALAYIFLWAWEEHLLASQAQGEKSAQQIVFLIDEIECHLHPRWQRSILGSILKLVTENFHESHLQVVAATHSPLVLASVESLFDPSQDAWFDIDLNRDSGYAEVMKRPFVRLGGVSNWLTSEAFNLDSDRSLDAEQAIKAARECYANPDMPHDKIIATDQQLMNTLGSEDRFWREWDRFLEKKGVAPLQGNVETNGVAP